MFAEFIFFPNITEAFITFYFNKVVSRNLDTAFLPVEIKSENE